VKLNMVVFEGTAEFIPEMVDHVGDNSGLQLQLIEYMPEIAGHPEWAIDIERVHEWLEERADSIEHREMHDRRRYWFDGGDASSEERSSSDRSSGRSPREDEASGISSDSSDGGMVEIVDPVENETFCANCHRVRVTHEGYLKGCLNRNDDLRPMGAMSRAEIREAFREVVANRVPYYGEYMIRDGDGGWRVNDEYVGA
jgi:cyclic pyranopterin phosphate synthase